jgi:uroporphyrinogen decarboxylase
MSGSRDIVRKTLTFDNPERVARSFHASDFVSARPKVDTYASDWEVVGPTRWERKDEWGNTWGRVDPTSKGEVEKGVLDDFADLDTYVFPDFSNPEDYHSVQQKRSDHPDEWMIGGLPGFAFNIARKMRRMEQYLVDLLLERDRIIALHDRIDDLLENTIRNYAETGVDAIMFPEDWGTQNGMLISPELWRDEFFPRFERLCTVAHEHGLFVFMHSCGKIEAIVPGLIEAGIDLLQFDQPDLHGIDRLAAYQESDNITFWCPVDIQATLQRKERDAIESKVDEMLDKLWRGRGGFVAGYYGDNASIGLDPEWQEIACQRFTTQGSAERYVVAAL